MSALALSRRGLGEVWWWLSRTAGYGWRHKRLLLLAAWLLVSSWMLDLGWPWLPLLVVTPVLVLLIWERWWPVGFQVQVTDRLFKSRTRRWLRRRWTSVMEACGLARRLPSNESAQVPALGRLTWEGSQLVASPRLLTGQTVEDVEGASERLRVALNANRLRVIPDPASTGCRLVWSFGDLLASAFAWPVPDDQAISLDWVTLGRTEDGQTWRIPLRVSNLTAGSTGSGKGSVLWGTVLSLAPAVRAGLVQLHGVDLKGGMELGLGKDLFTRYATDAAAAVILLEEAVVACEERAKRLAGNARLHTPTTDEPLVVVVIDELASLVAYLPDRDLLKRAEAALSRLLSIGRAPGYYVYAFLQDPRKETVKMRHLFTQSIGLRLRDREECAMVLGDGAVASGAACHKIHRSMPGVGYAVGEDGLIVKVRAGFVADDTIRATAARFATPVQLPIVKPAADDETTPPRPPRKPRTNRRRRDEDDTARDEGDTTGEES